MKQGILVTAYRNLSFVTQIIDYFDEDFEFFIHIDKKCKEDISIFNKYYNVNIFVKYKIEWGGNNHLLAILLLIQEASKSNQLEYFHLITGSDFPIKPLPKFKSFFEAHKNDNYIEHFPLPHSGWGEDGGLRRVQYFWFGLNKVDVRGKWWEIIRASIRLQKKLRVKRKIKYFDDKLWGGGTYWSLSKKALDSIIVFINETPGYIKRFKYTCIAEEIFIQTILINSNINVTNNYLRYIDWGMDGANPDFLNESDFDKIIKSDCFFARKFDEKYSDKLIKMIKESNSI